MSTDLDDLARIKQANFTHHVHHTAQQMVICLAGLREIAKERGISIEDITVEHIVESLAPLDAQIRENAARLRQTPGQKQ